MGSDTLLPVQCRMARAGLGLGVRDLARLAQVSPTTVTRLERGDELYAETIAAIRIALEEAGAWFPPYGAFPTVQIRDHVA